MNIFYCLIYANLSTSGNIQVRVMGKVTCRLTMGHKQYTFIERLCFLMNDILRENIMLGNNSGYLYQQ